MKKRNFPLTNFAVHNRTTIYFFTVVLIIFGVIAYNNTPKESFPEVVFPYYSVVSIYPGTSPSDIENLVTRPVEKQIKSVDGVKSIESKSLQDYSLIFIEFETNVNPDDAYRDINEAVDRSKPDLPAGLISDPQVSEINVSEFPILYINLSGDISLNKLKEYADVLQDDIEGLEEITRVDIVGALEREFLIDVDLYKMQAAGLSFDRISQAVAFENMSISSGQLRSGGTQQTLRIIGEFKSIEDLQNILLMDGIYLKDIADVKDGYADAESYSRINGKNVITLNVVKKTGKNLIEAVDKIKIILEDFKEDASPNLIISTSGDQSTSTRNSVNNLFNTIILGFLIVVLVLMFFMGIDNALFVAVAIPLSMLIAFIFVNAVGFTMNMVVLMAFILVLGIVVDNSIVVVENIYRHYMFTPNLAIAPAAKLATAEVAGPVFAGTLTTIAPFFPLMFWPGVVGEFMVYIPVTIIMALAASMIVAYFMNPVYAVTFMKYRKEGQVVINHKKNIIAAIVVVLIFLFSYLVKLNFIGNLIAFVFLMYLSVRYVFMALIRRFQKEFIPFMMKSYRSTLGFLIKGNRAYVVIGSTIFLLFFTFFFMSIKSPKVVFFPDGDPDVIMTYLVLPSGTDLDVTDSFAQVVEDRVIEVLGKDNPDVESVITNVAVNAGESVFERSTQSKLAKLTITFVEYKYRIGKSSTSYIEELRENLKDIAGVDITVAKMAMGPPTGKPINLEVSGEKYEEIIPIVDRLIHHMDSLNIPGIEKLKTDLDANNPELIINVDRTKANKLGLSTAYIGMVLRNALFGQDISTFREGEDEYNISMRLQEKYRENLDALMSMTIMMPGGENGAWREIPISAVATVEHSSSFGGIVRKDHKRVVTIYSNVLEGYNANEIVQRLNSSLADFQLPKGYTTSFTGEQQEQDENAGFLGFAFIISIVLIFVILVIQFNSISKPLIILVQIVFSLIGVLLGLSIFGLDISIIMSGMGIIAVAGIVVKNAIILIDYAELKMAAGGDRRQAIIDASATRLTPVILTAASTILALLPLAVGVNIDFTSFFTTLDPDIYFGGPTASFWKPLAWSIIFGLSFATFLTLVVVPSMLTLSKVKKKKGEIEEIQA
ncbi:MAG: efflux RND transporter permease subunit [Bacteroidetes bacterium]|nr:efflux RND transporter permease subunit [Bacteroidota bacterium]